MDKFIDLSFNDILKGLESLEFDKSCLFSCKVSCTCYKDIIVYYLRLGLQSDFFLDDTAYITIDYTDFDLMITVYKEIEKIIKENFIKGI